MGLEIPFASCQHSPRVFNFDMSKIEIASIAIVIIAGKFRFRRDIHDFLQIILLNHLVNHHPFRNHNPKFSNTLLIYLARKSIPDNPEYGTMPHRELLGACDFARRIACLVLSRGLRTLRFRRRRIPFLVQFRVLQVQLLQRTHDHGGDHQVAQPLVVGRHNIPGSPLSTRFR
jgi:hypothetical protein